MVRHRRWWAGAFVEREASGAFRTLSSFVSTELHDRSHDLGKDHPGRVKESASPSRHAGEPCRDLHDAAKEDFVRTVAAELSALHAQGQFDELVLVAPARVLGEIKVSLSKPMAKVVVKELQKDLTKVPDHELTGHLSPSP